jgi:Ca2+-transporting ATPase
MGITGTAVAKEAAAMVLTDDNFATIVSAVRQGRRLYDNILKFVRFQLSTTMGAILTVFFAPLAGLPEPFTPIQILWVAIIMDGPPAVSLALDAARPGIMAEPPRRRTEPILPFARLTKIIAYGLTMMLGTLTVLYYRLHTGTEQRALTLAFTTFVLFQFFNVFNARNEQGTAFNAHLFANAML